MYSIWGYLLQRSLSGLHSLKVIFEICIFHEICQISWNLKSARFHAKMPNELRSHGSIFIIALHICCFNAYETFLLTKTLLLFHVLFGSFGNEPMQSCSIHHCCCWCWHQHLCTAIPVTALIIETSYLTDVCAYIASLCTWNIKSMWHVFFKW